MTAVAVNGVRAESAEAEGARLSWKGRTVVFLGDSITDAIHVGCKTNYWGFLAERMGFAAHVYGKNGCQMIGIPQQVDWAKKELGDKVDAVFIFMGTNDYNGNVPMGDRYVESVETVQKNAEQVALRKRELSLDAKTFRGRTNLALQSVKKAFPAAQVILMTPIHRGFAQFGAGNVQPDERYANTLGLFIGDYVAAVKDAGVDWSTPVIDLYGESGLLPNMPEYDACLARPNGTDRLHPSTAGHDRLARTIEARLRALPPSFRP